MIVGNLSPPQLEFGEKKVNSDPIQAFGQLSCKPNGRPDFDEIKIIVMLEKGKVNPAPIMSILDDLKSGGGNISNYRDYFPGFKSVFGVDINSKEFIAYENETDCISKLDSIQREIGKSPFLVLIAKSQQSPKCGLYHQVRIHSIIKNISTQFLTKPNIDKYPKLENGKGDFLWNLGVGCFAKMGGVPWKLSTPLKDTAAVVGINTVVEWDEGITTRRGITALEVVNEWGEAASRFFSSQKGLKRKNSSLTGFEYKDVESVVSRALHDIIDSVRDPKYTKTHEYLIFHLSDAYSTQFYDTLEKAINETGFQKYKIIRISGKSHFREFNPKSTDKKKAWPYQGRYLLDESSNHANLYTKGRFPYMGAASEPYTPDADDVAPIGVGLVRCSQKDSLLKEDLNLIFELTRLSYRTADVSFVGLPITIKLGKLAADLALCGLSNHGFPIKFLY